MLGHFAVLVVMTSTFNQFGYEIIQEELHVIEKYNPVKVRMQNSMIRCLTTLP